MSMKVMIYSRQAFEQLIHTGIPENTVFIRFYDSGGQEEVKRKFPAENGDVFEIVLDDIDVDDLEELGLFVDMFFPEAEALARFIYRAHDRNLDIICQCEYGQSRSAACAAAILEHFRKDGISIFRDYRYFPNKLIFNKVFEALEKLQK